MALAVGRLGRPKLMTGQGFPNVRHAGGDSVLRVVPARCVGELV